MATQEEIKLVIRAVADQAIRDLDKLNKSLDTTEKKTSGMSGILKSAQKNWLAVTGAIAACAGAYEFTIGNAAEAEKVQAQLNAVLASTKGVAGMTAQAVNDLAEELSQMSTFDDEAIVGAESLLLTFTKIGRDIFPEATRAIVDISTALGQDLNASAIQVGKALQDPILGVTALRRVGVNFSADQQAVIKSLVETGRAAEAQKLILKELSTEFGGSAAAAAGTFSGQLTILKNNLANMGEGIGKGLLPALKQMAENMNTVKWAGIGEAIGSGIGKAIIGLQMLTEGFFVMKAAAKIAIAEIVSLTTGMYAGNKEAQLEFYKAQIAFYGKKKELINYDAEAERAANETKKSNAQAHYQALSEMDAAHKQEKVDREQLYIQWGMEAAQAWLENERIRLEQAGIFEKAYYTLKQSWRAIDVAQWQTYSQFMLQNLDKQNKAQMVLYKAFSIQQTLMDTYRAAMAAYAALAGIPFVGPALGAAAAASAIAVGMLRVNAIRKMEEGGIIKGTGAGSLFIAGENRKSEAIIPFENPAAMEKLAGVMGGGPTINMQFDGCMFANESWPAQVVEKIDKELFKLARSKSSLFAEVV